jgi:hypothetical protein
MRKYLLASACLLMLPLRAEAQVLPAGGQVVSSCGTPYSTYTAGQIQPLTQDTTGKACSSSSGGGGGAATIADGADVNAGSTTDAAATPGSTGTLSAKQRLMTTQLNTISTNTTNAGTPTLQSGSTTAVTQATGTNLHAVIDSGTITAVTGITNALPAGTNIIGSVTPAPMTPTDRGGTMTTGGTQQTLAASNASRKSLLIQNPCTAAGEGGIGAIEDLYLSITGSATVAGAGNTADLPACSSVTVDWNGHVWTGAVSVNAATTGHRWSAVESQ